MKLIQDFTQLDTATLFRALRSFKRFLIGFPVILTLPAVGFIALKPQLWWLFPVYVIAILFGAVMIGTAYGRLVAELRVRELEKAEPENRTAEGLLQRERDMYIDVLKYHPTGVYLVRVFNRNTRPKDAWKHLENPPYVLEFVNEHFCELLDVTRMEFERNPGIVFDLVYPFHDIGFAYVFAVSL